MPIDRNRGPGRVPGSPWNLSIRPTRSPPPRLPTYSFFTSLRPYFSLSRVLLSLRLPTCFLDSLPNFKSFSPPSPQISLQLLHHFSFFIFFLFHSLFFLYVSVSLFSPSFFASIYRSHFAHFPRIFFLYTPQIFLPVSSQKITANLRSPLSVLIRAFIPATTPRERERERAQHFSMKYHGYTDETSVNGQTSVLLRTSFNGLMITEKLLDQAKASPFLPTFFRRRFFNLCVEKGLRRIAG